jgi:polar amino acid transport system substrate-binding protein
MTLRNVAPYLCSSMVLLATHAYAREPVQLAVLTTSPPSVAAGIMLTEIFRQANIPMVLIAMPAVRSSVEAGEGRVDGEVARVQSYGELHPTLIRVEPAIDFLSVSAYYKKKLNTKIDSQDDLKPYSVGYVRGLKVPCDLVKNVPYAQETTSSKSLVRMLKADRFDVIVNNNGSTDFYINKFGLKDIERVELSHEPLHLYLHQKNRDLVPTISGIIKKLSDNGELAKLRAKANEQTLLEEQALPE